jgi:hypothetical protein
MEALASSDKLRTSYVHLTENSHFTANMHLPESLNRTEGKDTFYVHVTVYREKSL